MARILLALYAVLPLAAWAHTTLPFTFGWRHYLGEPGVATCSDPSTFYPLNYSAVQCSGLQGLAATSVEACAAAACAEGALVWQFCTVPGCGGATDCWAGTPTSEPCNSNGHWVGAGHAAPPPQPNPPASLPSYDDSAWEVVDAPHDALITTPYKNTSNNGQGSIPKSSGWYRKHLVLPASWEGSLVEVYFEGAFSVVNLWLNGNFIMNHSCGYTSFSARLDNVTGVVWGGENVLAISFDPTATGWWYEGAGLFREITISSSSLPLRIPPSGLFAPTFTMGAFHARATPALGLYSDNATIAPVLSIEHAGSAGSAAASFHASYAIYDATGALVAQSPVSAATSATAGAVVVINLPLTVLNAPELWSIPRPYLYTVNASLFDAASGALLDSRSSTLGIRSVRWDALYGAFINEQPTKLRGFCNHASFAAVGMGVPQRINLLRMQQMRGMGANSWRLSHNPGTPSTFALGDALGMTFLDENRVFSDSADSVANMRDMVRRDRVHPAILYYSYCNEAGCSGATQPALDFKLVTEAEDGSRATTMNYFWKDVEVSPNASAIIDLQGFSHDGGGGFDAFHARYPEKPLVASECCSCESQRGEDSDINHNTTGNGTVTHTSFTQSCTASQSQVSNGRAFVAGTYVWTAHDYYGEPGGWPHISSSFGQFDLAGFGKSPSYWYRSAWLSGVPASDPARPPLSGGAADTVVHIVEAWQPPNAPGAHSRRINVYTNAPAVALSVNGARVGLALVPALGWATFPAVNFTPGTLSAEALGADNATVLASAERHSWGAPASLLLTLDAPSPATGTGSALFLDGSDVALLRAEVLDAAGHRVEDGVVNVTFAVSAGPGLVVGCGNGDPANRDPNQVPWKPAYHGLVRAVVRVTLDAASPPEVRAARLAMELQAGAGPRSSSILPVGSAAPTSMTVTASAPGLPVATLVLQLSVDPADAPLAAAAASVAAADLG